MSCNDQKKKIVDDKNEYYTKNKETWEPMAIPFIWHLCTICIFSYCVLSKLLS